MITWEPYPDLLNEFFYNYDEVDGDYIRLGKIKRHEVSWWVLGFGIFRGMKKGFHTIDDAKSYVEGYVDAAHRFIPPDEIIDVSTKNDENNGRKISEEGRQNISRSGIRRNHPEFSEDEVEEYRVNLEQEKLKALKLRQIKAGLRGPGSGRGKKPGDKHSPETIEKLKAALARGRETRTRIKLEREALSE